MPYFQIMTGLSGCYMPDNTYVLRADTRKALKAALADEAYFLRDAGFVGVSKKAIAALAADAWRRRQDRRSFLPIAVHYGYKGNLCNSLSVGNATRTEFMAQDYD